MLQIPRPTRSAPYAAGHRQRNDAPATIGSDDVWRFLRRRWRNVACTIAVVLLPAVSYILLATPRFTADAFVLVEPQKARQAQTQAIANEMGVDSSLMDSQVEIGQSGRVILKVIQDLQLEDDPEFSKSAEGFPARLLQWIRLPHERPAATEDVRRSHLLATFRHNLTVRRVALTNVLRISYTSIDPAKAARITNQVAHTYVGDLLRAKYDATVLAGAWLDKRVRALHAQAFAAEHEAQRFRAANSFVLTTGRGVDEQQLTELNTQLILARAQSADTRAKLDRIESIISSGDTDAVVNDALRSEVIGRLRSRLLDAARSEANLIRQFGPQHEGAKRLHEEVEGLKDSIVDELNRIAEGYRSDYEIAKSREEFLASSLKSLIDKNMASGHLQITLRDLERDAHTSQALYETFLTRRKELAQQESFPVDEARIITAAVQPLHKSYPRTTLVIGGALCVGMLSGIGVALFREHRDHTFRTRQQVERELGIKCLGLIPTIKGSIAAPPRQNPVGREIRADLGVGKIVVSEPLSAFAQAIDRAKVEMTATRTDRKTQVVGVVSALPDEGASTIASNLAYAAAMSGQRVLLIDADLRAASLTRAVAGGAAPGLCDLLIRRKPLADLVWREPASELSMLPSGSQELRISPDILGSIPMRDFLENGTDRYDLVLLDLPALASSVDARCVSSSVDAFVLVLAWGRTSRTVVQNTLSEADSVYERLIGCILNRADIRAMRRFDPDYSRCHLSG
jgi:succinoglycan biosynthesis transport protein ExoP